MLPAIAMVLLCESAVVKKEVNTGLYIPKENKTERTSLAKSYHKEQRERQLVNKIENRSCSVDLNPEYIGFNISDNSKIIYKEVINLTKLNYSLKFIIMLCLALLYDILSTKNEVSRAYRAKAGSELDVFFSFFGE